MGHKISREQIDPGVKDHIMSFVGDVADLETEVNTDIISAVNSLMVDRVDNAENMGKLANAIGEPVTANHSVDEVVEGLGEMLNSFKTNMMNNGITVESGDKFKALIDKIATMVEEGEGKGVQIASGESTSIVNARDTFTYVSGYSESRPYVDITNLGFIPSTIIYISKSNTTHFGTLQDIKKRTSMELPEILFVDNTPTSNSNVKAYVFLANDTVFRSDGTIRLPIVVETATDFMWIAFGVGEEDTTLRDSLASILEDEGVSVTEEDDMASLITKVDEEFDRKKANSSLDIISATELPATGKENQICIITDSPTDTILLTSSVADTQSEGINIYLGNSSSNDVSMGTLVPISTNGITMNYYFNRIYQGSNRLASYYYINNTWTPLTNKYIPIFEDGVITTTELNSGLNMNGAAVTNGEIIFEASTDGAFYLIYSKNKINFNDISKIEVVLKKNNSSYNSRIYACSSTNPSVYSNDNINQAEKVVSSTSYTTWTIDTSSWTGTHYFVIQKYNEFAGLYCYIQSIRFY